MAKKVHCDKDIGRIIWKYTTSLIVTILFIGTLFFIGATDVLSKIEIANIWYFCAYILVSIIIFAGFVFRWKIILQTQGYNISFKKLFNYTTAGFGVSYVTPSAKFGGEPVRIFFLKKEGIKIEDAIGSVFTDKSIEIIVNLIATGIGLLMFLFFLVLPINLIWLILVCITLIVIIVSTILHKIYSGRGVVTVLLRRFRIHKIKFLKSHLRTLRRSEDQMLIFFKNHKGEYFKTILISAILWILTVFEFKFLIEAFGITASISEVFLIVITIAIAYVMPIPAALGTLEGFQVSLFKMLSKDLKLGFIIGFVTRARDMIWAIYGFAYLYFNGFSKNLFQPSSYDKLLGIKEKYLFRGKSKARH